MALIFLRINQGLAGRDADHNGALWHVPGHNRISTHASTRTDDNGPQYLRSRTNDRAIANGGVPLARDSVRRVRSAHARQSAVLGKSVSVRLDSGGSRYIQNKKN